MSLSAYLRKIREDRQLSLRDVERLAKEGRLGAEVSSGYLSMLERDGVKGPSPRILYALATVYEVDYMEMMRKAGYVPDDVRMPKSQQPRFAFKGASQLSQESRQRVQRMIQFELNEQREAKKQRNKRDERR